MDKLKLNKSPGLNSREALHYFLQIAVSRGYAYAVWKYPNDPAIHFLVDFSGKEKSIKPELNELAPGFLISRFLNKKNDAAQFISADLYYKIDSNNISLRHQNNDQDLAARAFETEVEELKESGRKLPKYYASKADFNSTKRDDFTSLVSLAIENIKNGNFEKLVPSKVKVIDLDSDFDINGCFDRLVNAYPNAMVSLVGTPSLGTWIGASPEVLVSIDAEGIFKTVALAGTQKVPDTPTATEAKVAQASWTQKEIEEQALVSRYVISCFKKIRLREFEERGPKTILAGNLMHLKTEYTVDTKEVNFPELPTVMLELLHPTSAVSGMPRESSFDFLEENEKLDRRLFSGYLGPVNIEGATDIFVNIRCMQLLDQKAALYAGAGVTADSNPEKEWLETEMKCDTLLSIINKKN